MKRKDIRRFNLDEGFNPEDIKGLNTKELEQLSEDVKAKIISSCAVNGGHLASSLGATDLIVALHHYFNLPKDKVLFDVGHQCYAHKVLSGRSLDRLRKTDGVSNAIWDPATYIAKHFGVGMRFVVPAHTAAQ